MGIITILIRSQITYHHEIVIGILICKVFLIESEYYSFYRLHKCSDRRSNTRPSNENENYFGRISFWQTISMQLEGWHYLFSYMSNQLMIIHGFYFFASIPLSNLRISLSLKGRSSYKYQCLYYRQRLKIQIKNEDVTDDWWI